MPDLRNCKWSSLKFLFWSFQIDFTFLSQLGFWTTLLNTSLHCYQLCCLCASFFCFLSLHIYPHAYLEVSANPSLSIMIWRFFLLTDNLLCHKGDLAVQIENSALLACCFSCHRLSEHGCVACIAVSQDQFTSQVFVQCGDRLPVHKQQSYFCQFFGWFCLASFIVMPVLTMHFKEFNHTTMLSQCQIRVQQNYTSYTDWQIYCHLFVQDFPLLLLTLHYWLHESVSLWTDPSSALTQDCYCCICQLKPTGLLYNWKYWRRIPNIQHRTLGIQYLLL